MGRVGLYKTSIIHPQTEWHYMVASEHRQVELHGHVGQENGIWHAFWDELSGGFVRECA